MAFEATLMPSGRRFAAPADRPLLVAAEEAGAYCYLPKGSSAELICHAVLKAREYSRT